MKSSARHITTLLIISCYLTIVLTGQNGILHSIINTGNGEHQVDTGSNSIPSDFKIYFAQGKHLPLTIKIQVPSESILSIIQFPEQTKFIYPNYSCTLLTLQSFKFIRYLPRDPPVA